MVITHNCTFCYNILMMIDWARTLVCSPYHGAFSSPLLVQKGVVTRDCYLKLISDPNHFSLGLFLFLAYLTLFHLTFPPYLSLSPSFLKVRAILRGWKTNDEFSRERCEGFRVPWAVAVLPMGGMGDRPGRHLFLIIKICLS